MGAFQAFQATGLPLSTKELRGRTRENELRRGRSGNHTGRGPFRRRGGGHRVPQGRLRDHRVLLPQRARHRRGPRFVCFAGAKRFFSRSQEQKDAFKAKERQLGYSDTTAPGGKRIEQLKFGTQLYLTDCCALNENEKKDQSKTQGNESEAAWLQLDGTQERWRETVHEYFSSMRSVAG